MGIIRSGLAVLLILAATSVRVDSAKAHTAGATCPAGMTTMARVDLFFGATGTPAAWRQFLANVVTPRFPDGLTAVEGTGQWRGPGGLARERSHILIIYYRRDTSSEARIDAIRTLYKRRFQQTSVLRADTTACVSF